MATGLVTSHDVTSANSALLSAALQRAVKAAFAEYVAQLAHALKLRQGVVATAVVRLDVSCSLLWGADGLTPFARACAGVSAAVLRALHVQGARPAPNSPRVSISGGQGAFAAAPLRVHRNPKPGRAALRISGQRALALALKPHRAGRGECRDSQGAHARHHEALVRAVWLGDFARSLFLLAVSLPRAVPAALSAALLLSARVCRCRTSSCAPGDETLLNAYRRARHSVNNTASPCTC
jgi:hypothetical protein